MPTMMTVRSHLHTVDGPAERELIWFFEGLSKDIDCVADQKAGREHLNWMETHTPQDDITGPWFQAINMIEDLEDVEPMVHGLCDDDLEALRIVDPERSQARLGISWVYEDVLGPIIP